LTIYIYCIS